ncbi:MAG: hypothetical protein ACI8Z9_001033, partial [Paraglaciecola sp.]
MIKLLMFVACVVLIFWPNLALADPGIPALTIS